MIRSEILSFIIILVFIQPSESTLYRFPENFRDQVDDSGGTRGENHLSLLHSIDERLSFLVLDLDRGPRKAAQEFRRHQNTQNGGHTIWNWVERKRGSDNIQTPELLTVSNGFPSLHNDVAISLKKRQRHCDASRFTLQTLIEYLQTGRICGRRVANVRFGLGGKKR